MIMERTLVDGSTDLTQDHYMAVLFQYVTKQGDVAVAFYKLIEVKLDESAEGHLDVLMAALKEDELWNAMKSGRLSAVVSGIY